MSGGGRSSSMDRQSRASEAGRSRAGSAERDRPSRRLSVMDAPVQRAPDFRGEKNKNLQELIAFLQEWEMENSETYTVKMLQCPSTKVFLNIFRFLLDIIMPGHALGERYEEEIPYIFKTIGYPYIISRSAIVSIAPHSWPQLCHALVWLTRSISEIGQTSMEVPDFFSYVIDVAQNPEQEAKFEEEMKSSMLGPHLAEEVSLQNQLDKQMAKLEELNKEVSNEQELLESIDKYEKNCQSLDNYLEETRAYLAAQEQQVKEEQLTCQRLSDIRTEKYSRREKLEAENKERLVELSPQEREQMLEEQRGLIEQLKVLNTECETLSNKNWDIEIKMSQGDKELSEMWNKFNKLVDENMDPSVASKLHLTSASMEEVSNFIEPYLMKTQEDLLNDVVLQDSYSKREQLNANLNNLKTELDSLRQQLKETKAADSAILESLHHCCQTLVKKKEDFNARLHKLSAATADKAATAQAMQEELDTSTAKLEQKKKDNEKEEARRVEVLRAKKAECERKKVEEEEKIHEQILAMEEMVAQMVLLKSEWTALCVKQKIAMLKSHAKEVTSC